MEKTALEGLEKAHFFTIRVGNGNVYFAKIKKEKDVFTVGNVDGKEIITESNLSKYASVEMTNVFVIVPTKDGPVPVKYEDMPGGSSVMWVNTSQVSEFNVIDSNGKLLEALEAIDSGILSTTTSPDLSKSSRGLVGKS